MILRYMLDSNFCIRLLRNRPETARTRFNEASEQLCISTIVLHELMFGADKSDSPAENHEGIRQLRARLAVVPFDDGAAAHSGEIRALLQKTGQTIGTLDVMIAGHARSLGLIVVTNNLREFQRVEGLRCEDW